MKYQNVPTPENYSLWMEEQQITATEVMWRKYVGTALAIGNLGLMGWLAVKFQEQAAPDAVGTNDTPDDGPGQTG
jgi:hypothetical protein